jgi:hypothetical protein
MLLHRARCNLISYLCDATVLLLLLGIPWTAPLMVLSGLILHATVNGKMIMSVGSLIGVLLNLGIYIYFFGARAKKKRA